VHLTLACQAESEPPLVLKYFKPRPTNTRIGLYDNVACKQGLSKGLVRTDSLTPKFGPVSRFPLLLRLRALDRQPSCSVAGHAMIISSRFAFSYIKGDQPAVTRCVVGVTMYDVDYYWRVLVEITRAS
jgi:hypothetical protein